MVAKYAKLLTALALLLAVLLCLPVLGMAESMEYALRSEFNLGENPEVEFDPARFYVDNREYVYEKFIRDWDGDGTIEADELNERISIEWSGVEFVGTPDMQFGNHDMPEVLVATVASPTEDCEVKLVLTNTETGDTFVYTHELDCSYLYAYPLQVSVNGQIVAYDGSNVELPLGASVSVTILDEYLGTKEHSYEYTWRTYDGREWIDLPLNDATYTFTMEHENYTINCYAMLQFEDTPVNGSSYHHLFLRSERPDITLNVQTSHPVVDGVISVTEGDTVTIATNPTCEDATIEFEAYWDVATPVGNGRWEYDTLDETSPTLTFVATEDMNGQLIYCEITSANGPADYAWIEYTLNVTPKEDEPIKLNPSYSHPVKDGVMYITEGETVTITGNPSCSDPDATFVHFWLVGTYDENGKFVEDAPPSRESTYSFVATADMNGKVIDYSAGRSGYKPGSFELKLVVNPKTEGSITLSPSYSHPVKDGMMYVTEGETVTITGNPSCSDPDATFVHFWLVGTYDENGKFIEDGPPSRESTYSFVATADMNGKVIDYSAGRTGYKPGSFELKLVVEPKAEPVVENFTLMLMLNGVTDNRPIDLRSNRYLLQNFFSQYDIEDLTITANSGEKITDLAVTTNKNYPCITYTANEQSDGEIITVTVVSKDGNTYIANYEIALMSIVRRAAVINPESGAVMTQDNSGDYNITVKEGTTLTLTVNYELLAGGTPDMIYEWRFLKSGFENEEQNGQDNSYTFVVRPEHGTAMLEVTAENVQNPDEWDSIGFNIIVEPKAEPKPITLNMSVTGNSRPNVDGTQYLDEGDNLTFTVDASYEGEQVDLTYAWYSEIRDESGNVTSQTQLNGTGNTLNITAAVGMKYITCYVEGSGLERTSCTMKVSVKPEDKGEITVNPSCSHRVENDVLTVTEGETVTITGNPSCSDPDATFVHFWLLGTRNDEGKFVEEAMLGRESTYSFVASSDMNGKCINYSAGRTGYKPGSFEYQLNVMPKQTPSVTLNAQVNHPVVDDVITVTEGDTVTINTNPTCSDTSVELVHHWFLHTYDNSGECIDEVVLNNTASAYTFVATTDMNGKHVYCEVYGKDVKTNTAIMDYQLKVEPKQEVPPTIVTFDVETSHPVVNDVMTVTEGDTVTIDTNMSCNNPDAEIVYYWAFEIFNENGSYVGGERIQNDSPSYSFVAKQEHNGQYIYAEAYPKDIDCDYPYLQYLLKVEPKPEPQPEPKPITLTVTPYGGQQGFVNGTKYLIEGEKVPFRASATYEGDPVALTYTWYLETRDANGNVTSRVQLPCTESTYNLTAEMDQSKKYLTCYVEGEGLIAASASVKLSVTYQTVGNITLNVKSSHPVSNNVLTVTDGDTVTISANPSSPLENAEYHYMWFYEVRDENGKTISEEKLNCSGNTYTFRASSALNGKYIYCSVGADRLRPGSFAYKLKVMTPVPEMDEKYVLDVEEGVTTETLSEDLKEIPELNTPAKVEADITIKVLAEAKSEGVNVETVQEQTAVYDVTLMYSEDGGETFVEATKENWPESGKITVTLPYPEGTGRYTHTFVVAHMFTQTTADHKAGDVEYPAVTNTANGIQFQVSGLSPIAIAWDEKPVVPTVPQTGDEATPYLWLLAMISAGIGCVVLASKRRQNS